MYKHMYQNTYINGEVSVAKAIYIYIYMYMYMYIYIYIYMYKHIHQNTYINGEISVAKETCTNRALLLFRNKPLHTETDHCNRAYLCMSHAQIGLLFHTETHNYTSVL